MGIPNPKDQRRVERQLERMYLIHDSNQKKVYPGEDLPPEFWDWTELEYKALKHMINRGWKIWDIADELGKSITCIAVAIMLWAEEDKL